MAGESGSSEAGAGRASRSATAVTLAAAALCWAILASQAGAMSAMESGLGTLPSFIGTWTLMMAAMMLPSALSFIRAYAGLPGRNPWPILGIALCLASVYALTPMRQRFCAGCRTMCDQVTARPGAGAIASGLGYGLNCVGCSAGLMVVMLVAGMSDLAWMVIVAAIVLLYKVVPHSRVQDTGIALTMLAAGIWLVAFPASAPMLLMPNGHA